MTAAPLLKVLTVAYEVVRGPNAGEKFSFEKTRVTVGRGPENDLVLSQDLKVSRQHIEITVDSMQVTVKNLSDKNAMAIDGEIVTEKTVRPGAVIRIGDSELRLSFESKLSLAPAAVSTTTPVVQSGGTFSPPAFTNPGAVTSPGTATRPKAPPPPPGRTAPRPQFQQQGGSKLPIYIVVGLVLAGAYYLSQDQIRKKREVKLRDTVTTELSITESQTEYDKTLKDLEKRGQDTIQYKLSQEQYLRGFRDYRQGQYMRAMEQFQAALSFFPGHELARKYYTLSKRKFDEQIQFNMIVGKRYYGVKNYRLCMAFYSNVVKMKKEQADPIRREALQYYRECEVKLQGKY